MSAECIFIKRDLGCPLARFPGERGNCVTCSEKQAEDLVRSNQVSARTEFLVFGKQRRSFSRLTGKPIE